MIYQLVNKSSEILAEYASHIAHLYKQYNHVFALLISFNSMPRFSSIIVLSK